jgi:hypothetical protein
VKAHGLVAFLGYALLVTLKHLLKRGGSEYSPAKALQRLSELYRVDMVLPTIEGREIWLRRIIEEPAGEIPRHRRFSQIEVADGRVWMLPNAILRLHAQRRVPAQFEKVIVNWPARRNPNKRKLNFGSWKLPDEYRSSCFPGMFC